MGDTGINLPTLADHADVCAFTVENISAHWRYAAIRHLHGDQHCFAADSGEIDTRDGASIGHNLLTSSRQFGIAAHLTGVERNVIDAVRR